MDTRVCSLPCSRFIHSFFKSKARASRNSSGVNPKFCVKSISGANRAKFIYGGSGLVRLLPF